MSSPHDIAVRSGIDPQARVLCPIASCGEVFVMELGVSQWCKVRLANEKTYKDVEIVFHSHLCAFIARNPRGRKLRT